MNERLPETLQNIGELTQMVELYQERSPRRVLEIGVWHGGTLRQWLTAGKPEKVVAVDLHHPNAAAYSSWAATDQLITIHGSSQDPHVIEAMRAHGPYDWIFVDGDHAYDAVRTDVLNSILMIEPGGVLLIHDIDAPDRHPYGYPPDRVFQALGELYENDVFSSEEPSDVSHGIGVIYL